MTAYRNILLSAGEGSFRAAVIDRELHPASNYRLVFTDTLYEDPDAYRYLIEAAAFITQRKINWTVHADDFPDYRVSESVPIDQYRGNPNWRAFLADLRERACAAIPELVWLVEGHDPWEIFRDRRFLGNSYKDPCSEVAKRLVLSEWRSANCYRVGELFGPPDVFLVGIGDHEAHRFYGDKQSIGIQRANAKDGWIYEAPLITLNEKLLAGEPVPAKLMTLAAAPLDVIGPKSPRLYSMGYIHNNCGGFCCKAGQAHWANRFRVQPDRFAYDAMMERKIIEYLGGDYSMLTDRRGGEKRMMPLEAFAQRLRSNPTEKFTYQPGESGCGCMGVSA